MLALHRRVSSDEDMFIIRTGFDKVTVPNKSMWSDAVRLIIALLQSFIN
jgi:hypothetical protein